jgi:hypothetical protein
VSRPREAERPRAFWRVSRDGVRTLESLTVHPGNLPPRRPAPSWPARLGLAVLLLLFAVPWLLFVGPIVAGWWGWVVSGR